MKDAISMIKGVTPDAAQHTWTEFIQIGRAVFYLNQLTAQEKIDCAKHIKKFFKEYRFLYSEGKQGSKHLGGAAVLYSLGVASLVLAQPGTAKSYFDLASTKADQAKGRWFSGLLNNVWMKIHAKRLKDT